jgi:hypothetical protein
MLYCIFHLQVYAVKQTPTTLMYELHGNPNTGGICVIQKSKCTKKKRNNKPLTNAELASVTGT